MDKPVAYKTTKGELRYKINYTFYDSYGRIQRTSKGGFKTSREAKAFARQKVDEYENMVPKVSDKLTLGKFMELWLDVVKQHVKVKTHQFYVDTAKHFKELASLKLIQLNPQILERFYADKLKHGHLGKKGAPLSPTTIVHINRVLSIALSYAVKNEILMRNVASLVKLPTKKAMNYQWYSMKELYILDKLITGNYLEWPVRLAYRLGLRRGESVGLQWQDFNFEGKSCVIKRSLVYNAGKIFASTPKTKYGFREIPLTDEFCEQLKALKKVQRKALAVLGIEQTDNTFLCVTPSGNPYNPDYITRAFKSFLIKVGTKHGLKVIRFHDLRHSFASIAIYECGIAPEIVSKMLGHATSSFTVDTYGHASLEVKKEAAEKFDLKFNNYAEKEIISSEINSVEENLNE